MTTNTHYHAPMGRWLVTSSNVRCRPTMNKAYIESEKPGLDRMTLLPAPVGEDAAWERQPGDSARSFEAFRIYANLPTSERSLARAAEIVGKSHQQLLVWSSRDDWVFRTKAWDREQQRVADAARLEAIERTGQKAVEVGMLMLDAVEEQIPEAAKLLARSPRVLALWAEVAVKLIRDGLADGERITVASGPECGGQGRFQRHPASSDTGRGAVSPRRRPDDHRGQEPHR
jgi:hypothetical protein